MSEPTTTKRGDGPRGGRIAGCLLSWLAGMLLIGSVPYLALYTGMLPGMEILDDAGIDVRSPIGAATAGVALVVALATLAWSFGSKRRG